MKKSDRRPVEIAVLSDIHLGTYGCQAAEVLNYLKSIKPKILILNGDIIDIWQFKKRYFPKSHLKVLQQILTFASKKTDVYYITGNHDEMFRRFAGMNLGKLKIVNKLTLEVDGKKIWFFHGDVFDVVMQYSKWLAKLGAVGYDTLIYLNTFVNFISRKLGKGKVSLSKMVKENVKTALKYIQDFEETAAEMAINKNYDYIACGHIHHPDMRKIKTSKGEITYLNSGDWIENLSALEYNNGKWSLYRYYDDFNRYEKEDEPPASILELNDKKIFEMLLQEFQN